MTAACGFGISVNFNAVLRFFIIFCAVLRFSDLPYAPPPGLRVKVMLELTLF